MNMYRKKQAKGFTLIELLIVVTIMGVLGTIIVTSLSTARIKGRDAKRQGDLQELQKALDLYVTHYGSYPNPNAACGTSSNDVWSSWNCWNDLLPEEYMAVMPQDPENVDLGNCGVTANCHIYHYCVFNNNQSYILAVNLENPAPSGTYTDHASCAMGGPNYYSVGTY